MAHTDVSYTPVGWLNTPSTNTPMNATNLGNMDDGIEACANRANASVPFDNILSLAEAQSTTTRGTFVLDAVDSVGAVNRIGTNTITYENGDYYIKADNGVKKKLLSSGLLCLGTVSYKNPSLSVPSPLRSRISQNSIYLQPFGNNVTGWTGATNYSTSISFTPSYNSSTGVVTVSNLDYHNHYVSILGGAYVYAFVNER